MIAHAGEPRRDDGFILVEILAALSVIAVMAALMVGFMDHLRTVSRLEREVAARSELAAAASYVQRALSGAKALPLPDNEPQENMMFEGRSDGMRFAAVTRRGFYSLALRDIQILARDRGGQTQLVQTLAARRGGDKLQVAPFTEIVIDNDVSSVTFEYAGDDGKYEPKWSADGSLPRAVRITVARNIGGKTVSATVLARLL